jgi:hypothetical protein
VSQPFCTQASRNAACFPEQFIVMRSGPDAADLDAPSSGQSSGHCSELSANPARASSDRTPSTCAGVPAWLAAARTSRAPSSSTPERSTVMAWKNLSEERP